MDIISRLNRYLDTMNISSTRFADLCDIPRPSASQLLNGRNKKVSNEILEKIHASFPDLSMQWLIFGEGNPRAPLPGFNTTSTPNAAMMGHHTPSVSTTPLQNPTINATAPTNPPINAAADRAALTIKSPEEHNNHAPSNQTADALIPEPLSEPRPTECNNAPASKQPYTHNDDSIHPKTVQSPHEMAREEEEAPYYHSVMKTNDHKLVTSIIVVYSDGTTTTFVPK